MGKRLLPGHGAVLISGALIRASIYVNSLQARMLQRCGSHQMGHCSPSAAKERLRCGTARLVNSCAHPTRSMASVGCRSCLLLMGAPSLRVQVIQSVLGMSQMARSEHALNIRRRSFTMAMWMVLPCHPIVCWWLSV